MKNETVQMVALRNTYYAGIFHKEGEAFPVKADKVAFLIKMHMAELADNPSKREYKRRDMKAENSN